MKSQTTSLAFILEAFGIPQFTSADLITSGLINQTWMITTLSGAKYILQKVNHHVFKHPEEIALNAQRLKAYLSKTSPDYLFVAPKPAANGVPIVHHENAYYRIFDFIENSHTIDVVKKPEQAYEAALQFGQFTKKLSDFDPAQLHITIPGFHDLSFRYNQFQDALTRGNKSRLQQAQNSIDLIIRNRAILETYDSIRQNKTIKVRVTHHDTKISNVLFNEDDRGICVIDLDTVMPGIFISDFGDMMRTYLCPASEEETDLEKIFLRIDYFKAITEGYLQHLSTELNAEEKAFLVYSGLFMTYMQAMRFLTDYCLDDVYYGARYEGHNLNRARNQLVLLRHMQDHYDQMAAIVKNV